jgi:hypothetical protein
MHACFYGGGSGSKVTKSVAIIRDLTKTVRTPPFPSSPIALRAVRVRIRERAPSRLQMKAITLKLKGGDGARAWRQRSTAEDEDPQLQGKDASSSAKIAPHAEEHGGEKHCHGCCSPLEGGHTAEEEEQGTAPADEGDWMAEPEPGVLMTLSPLGDGANYLRRIRFSEEHFPDAQAARAWWEENFDRIAELYSIVVQYEHVEDDDEDDPAAPATPCHSEDDEHQRPVRDLILFDSIPFVSIPFPARLPAPIDPPCPHHLATSAVPYRCERKQPARRYGNTNLVCNACFDRYFVPALRRNAASSRPVDVEDTEYRS